MSPIISLVFDVLIFGLLSVTIFYCIKLSRQFSDIEKSKIAFENLIKSMNFASARAEAAIQDLKKTVNEEGSILQEKINKALGIESELEIIIQAGDSLADRLEQASSNRGSKVDPDITNFIEEDNLPDDSVASFVEDNLEDEYKTQAEIDLLEAVRRRQK